MKSLQICALLILMPLVLLTACSDVSLYQSDYIKGMAAEYSPECPPPEPCG